HDIVDSMVSSILAGGHVLLIGVPGLAKTLLIQTIFNPLSQAKNLVSKENLQAHLRRYPQAVHAGLRTITETTRRFIEAARETGIAGVFYAVQHAQYSLFNHEEYAAFGTAYDLQVLEPAEGLWLNMLHLHGEEIMFDQFVDYPVAIINWHDQETAPTLRQAQELFTGTVCGGLQREATMVLGTPHQVAAEAQAAFEATGGKHWILGTGCVVPITAPYGNILAARRSVDAFGQ
ncbi:MAG: uroporphyrinogen decarboxylase family protein, partial [Omnitrophica WOR_2 bacterium]